MKLAYHRKGLLEFSISRTFLVIVFSLSVAGSFAQSISVTNVATTPVCAGSSVTITFSATNGNNSSKYYTNSTVYTIYLSNSSGTSFAQIGSAFSTTGISYSSSNNGTTSGITTTVTIPSNTTTGSGYKISIGSTNPTFNGSGGAGASSAFTINALPTITLSASATSVCFSSGSQTTPLTYSATTNSPTTYSITWNASPSNSFATVTDSALPASPITITVPASTAAGTYTGNLTVKNANGCVSSSSSFTVTVAGTPTTATNGSTQSICSNGSGTLSGNTPSVGTGAWSVVSGPSTSSTQFSSTSNPAATFTPAGGAGSYVVRWTISNSPCTSSSADATITVNPLPTITLSSTAASVCFSSSSQTTSLTYSATTNSPTTYSITWNASPSNSFAAVTDASLPASPITITVPASTAAGTYTGNLTVKNGNGCVSSSSSFTVTVNPLPTITSSASATSVCFSSGSQTTPLTYSATTNSPTTYSITWNVSPSNSFATVTDAALPASPITITVPASTAAGIYTGNLTVKNANGCVSSSSSFTVTVAGTPTTATNGSTQSICSNGSGTLSGNTPSVGTGAWSVVSGPSTSSTQFSSTSNPTATFTPAGGVGSYVVRWTISNSPCTSSSADATITVNPLSTITLSSTAASVCFSSSSQTTSLTYSATTNSPTTYSITWNASPSNSFAAVTDASLPASPITITVPASTAAGTYTGNLTVKNGNGCASSTSSSFTVTVNPLPTITLPASSTSVCYNSGSSQSSSLTYSATTNSPISYTLTLSAPSFATLTDATLPVSPISISVPPGTSGGTYNGSLIVKNANGCVSLSSSFTLTVNDDVTGITLSAAAQECSNAGILVTMYSSYLTTGTYSVDYKFNNSGSTNTATGISFTAGSPGSGTFTTSTTSTSTTNVTLKSITIGGCTQSGLTISSNSFTVSSPPDISGNSLTATASGADIGNPNGSTVTLQSTKLSAGTYTVNYTVTDVAGTTTYITGSKSVTMATSTRKNKMAGTFTTGQLSTAGNYKVNIVSITNTGGCSSSPAISATFSIIGAFLTLQSGTWDQVGVWSATGTGPDYKNGTIIIAAGHTITYDALAISDTLRLDELIIYGTLIINSDQYFELKNGSGTDMTIQSGGKLQIGTTTNTGTTNGTLIFNDGVTHTNANASPSSAVTFNTQSLYKHLSTTTEGTPPLATWNSTSTFQVSGYTSSALTFGSSNWSQAFGEVVWNCPSQTADINLNGLLGGANTIQGGVTISSTGSAILRFGNSTDYSLTMSGNLTVSGSSRFSMGPSNGNGPALTLSVNNLVYGSTATTSTSWLCEAGIATVNISGSISVNSGTLFLSDGGGSILRSGATLNIAGDLTVASGATLSASSANSGRTGLLIFNNLPGGGSAKTHSYTINGTGTIAGYMLYQIPASQTVKAINESAFVSTATAAGSFSVASTATLVVQSTDASGAIQSGTTAGNIRVATAARTFTSGATIEYSGTAAQVISGTGHPTTLGVDCKINNSSGVSVSSTGGTVTIGGNLKVVSGNLTVTENNVTVSGNTETSGGNIIVNTGVINTGTTTLRIDGAINMTGGNIQMNSSSSANASNTSLLINGDLLGTNYFSFSGTNCQVTVGGTSPTTPSRNFPISGPTSLEQLTMNRSGATLVVPQALTVGNKTGSTYSGGIILTSGNVKMNASLVVTTYATLTTGILYFEGQTLELQRNISVYPSGVLSANSSSVLNITTDFAGVADTLAFSPSGNTLGTLLLNRSASVTPHIRLYTPLTISGNLNLTDGEFYNQSGLAMSNGATITRTPNSAFASGSAVPTGGPYNVIYNNGTSPTTVDLTTGIEAQGSLNNVTSNATGTVTLAQSMTGVGTLFINSGTWASGSNAISMGALANSGIFNSPTSTLTLTGNLTNNTGATFTHSSGTVVFNGTSSILYGANPLFNNITISGTLNAPALLKLVGNFTDNGIFSAGTGNVEFAGTTQSISGTSTPSFYDVLVDNTSTVTPVINVTSTNLLTNNGIFDSGANGITLKSLTNAGTFTASSVTTSISGNIANNATFVHNSGTVNFNGTSSISGSVNPLFNHILVTATLNGPALLKLAGDFTDNGTFSAGTGNVEFAGTTQTISGSSAPLFYDLLVDNTSTVTLARGISSTDLLTNNGTFNSGNYLMSLKKLTNNGTFNASSATTTMSGDLTNNAIFNHNSGIVNFNGTSFISGSVAPTFYDVLVNNTSSVTLGVGISSTDLLTNNGTFNSGAYGVSLKTLTNSGTFTASSTNTSIGGDFTNSGTFSNNSSTVTFSGISSILGTVNPVFNHISISGTLTGPSILQLAGDFNNNGSFVSGSNSVTFQGSGLQSITGSSVTDFNHINLTNTHSPVSLSVESTHNLKGILTLSLGAVLDADGSSDSGIFTLLSTGDKPTVDASIATLYGESTTAPSNNQVIGKVTVQRYMGRAGVSRYDYQVWRDITSPVQNATVQDLQASIPVTGPFIGSDIIPDSPSGYPTDYSISSIQRYDETVITDTDGSGTNTRDDGWIGFPSIDNSEKFVRGLGYSVFIFGKDSERSDSTDLWSLRGPINSGTISLPVTLTKSGAGGTKFTAQDGWNLVGNPYPSTIDWGSPTTGTPGWTRTNISAAISIDNYDWNNNSPGIYNGVPVFATYNSSTGIGTNGGSRYIATGQGFWVKASPVLVTLPELTIGENAKVAGTQTKFLRESAPSNLVRLTLASNGGLRDETVIYFSDKATEDVDDYDALKRFNKGGYLNLSSLSPAKDNYAINAMPFPDRQKRIPLDIIDVSSGTYSLAFTEFLSLPASLRLQLEDKYENTITDIRENSVYSFKVNKDNSATFGSARFSLIFGGEEIHPVKRINVYPIPVTGVLTIEAEGEEAASGEVLNMVGLSIGTLTFSNDGKNQIGKYDFSRENSGMYFIRIKRNDQVSVVRVVRD